MVLCCRLEQWFKPYREQAGAQRGRGCMDHILTLRLLTDYARKKKLKLFVTFIDFSKAYDNVPRDILMRVLRRLGCGAVMLGAIAAMYAVTESVLGTAVFATTMGVRQGSPTSCLLFIIFVNDLIKSIKDNCEDDGFLSWLHILVLMDDTVLLATTRERMLHKIGLMKTYCDNYEMKVNEAKTKFFVVGGNAADMEPLRVEGLEVLRCQQYSYLGATFTADGSVHQAVRTHALAKAAHVSKRKTYLEMNPSLCGHPIYLEKQKVPEKDRVAFTRFRVSSHSLAVEVGRWSRRGRSRLPLEERAGGERQPGDQPVLRCTDSAGVRRPLVERHCSRACQKFQDETLKHFGVRH
ncbi:uncharacterized protein LOC135108212 [Scylla paramamosain]|uniref:uncharacterized protein LOC135108212 n=1 Tax=Scylla paramamosain TaxID=85552 RepID=UPI0030834E37